MRASSSVPGLTTRSTLHLFTASPTLPVYSTVSTLRITDTSYSLRSLLFLINSTTLPNQILA